MLKESVFIFYILVVLYILIQLFILQTTSTKRAEEKIINSTYLMLAGVISGAILEYNM
jgi:uncharacterized protein YhhL (DUF1145 family)